MTKRPPAFVVLSALLLGSAACTDNSTDPASLTLLSAVAPQGGATNVDPNTTVSVEFSHAMSPGMEQYMAVHRGDLAGPLVSGSWMWSPDGTTCEFQPDAPFEHQMHYVIHVGGGIRDVHDHHVDFGHGATHMGGHMIDDDMMHDPMMQHGMTGPGWMHPDGSYGMGFEFQTF